MELLRKHAKIAINMYSENLDLNLLKEFKMEEIAQCYEKIEKSQINKKIYEDYTTIQREMIRNTETIEYLVRLDEEGIETIKVKDLIEVIQENNERLIDYSIDNVIKVMKDTKMNNIVRYIYLKYFIDKIKTNIGKEVIIKNIKYFLTQDNIQIQDLTIEEIQLFISPMLSNYNLIPRQNIKRVYELLVQNEELRKFIHFLYINKLQLPLKIEHYEKINRDIKAIYTSINKISKIIDNENLYRLLLKWINNDCSLYDLKVIEDRIGDVNNAELENAVNSKAGYNNFIFGNKISKLKLDLLDEIKEELVIYAIRNGKTAFLRLIEDNQEVFFNIPYSSILYEKEFYTEYVNINALNIKDLKDLQFMNNCNNYINLLSKGIYTFNEIKTLYDSKNESCYKLYNYLLDLKIDERLLRIKQIINKGSISKHMEDDQIEKLAKKIKIKSLYNWIEQDFKKINNIKPNDVVNLLINYEDVHKFVAEIEDRKELMYVLRNKELVSEYASLKELKNNIEKVDKYWNKLIDIMELSQEFIEKNHIHIKEFLLENGAELALKYYESCSYKNAKEDYKLIVKAELMGEFKKLKYHTDDLKRELDFDLEKYQVEEWTTNNRLENSELEVGEYDDFYSTMILGVEPMTTCLSYRGGAYNHCLLACFDSNKKILYAKVNGKIVARAMLRLTKGAYQNIRKTQSLSFIDLEKDDVGKLENKKEILTIFLEKSYISGISSELKLKIENMFIKISETKAKKMNALLVLSSYYKEYKQDNYIYNNYYMYISKSKAGTQYLDSLEGQATVSDEGQYKSNNFLIWKTKEMEESMLEESTFVA